MHALPTPAIVLPAFDTTNPADIGVTTVATDPLSDEERLLAALCREPREKPWLEFKENNGNPQEVGQYISALSNSAAISGRGAGYMVWGVTDETHTVVGTSFDPLTKRKGGEELIPWLTRMLEPQVAFEFKRVSAGELTVWILEVAAARHKPTAFSGTEFVRVGTYKKRLADHTELERKLWRTFETETFETGIARDRLDESSVLELLDYPGYFQLFGRPLPEGRTGIIAAMSAEGLIKRASVGWAVTNLAALLFARDFNSLPAIARKAIRVIQYRGTSRVETIREQEGSHGYAVGFEGLVDFLMAMLPANEAIGSALRTQVPMYPELAVRELVANMMIHQDFTMSGAGPMIEVFDDRIEIRNPGKPLINPLRFIDSPPKSRNEKLAIMMRRAGVCEERGSGWDKIAFQAEVHQLPAPRIDVTESSTIVTLFAPRELSSMDREERVLAIYQHACLRYVSSQKVTNATVRERFGIDPKSSAAASRLLNEAMSAGLIALYDPDVGPKARRYVPFWAVPDDDALA